MRIKEIATKLFTREIEELERVKNKISDELEKVARLIIESDGKVVITGIGKSGLIGRKIVSTLSSTGTVAVFMNAAEGVHGDLGVIRREDIVIAISNSGNSPEVSAIIPSIKKIGATLVGMTGNRESNLGREARYVLDIGVEEEGCPLNLAPMASATATLVMGDALAVVLMRLRHFKSENFAVFHPGGSLGKRLLMRVKDVMNRYIPEVKENDDIDSVIMRMTKGRLGIVCVVENDELKGVITEGDIRRALKNKENFFNLRAIDIMTKNYIYTTENVMAIEALELMEKRENQISVLPILKDKRVIGIVRIHDLLI